MVLGPVLAGHPVLSCYLRPEGDRLIRIRLYLLQLSPAYGPLHCH